MAGRNPDEDRRRLERTASHGTRSDEVRAAVAFERFDQAVAKLLPSFEPFTGKAAFDLMQRALEQPHLAAEGKAQGLVTVMDPNQNWFGLYAWAGDPSSYFQHGYVQVHVTDSHFPLHDYGAAFPATVGVLVDRNRIPTHGVSFGVGNDIVRRGVILTRKEFSRANPQDDEIRDLERRLAAGDRSVRGRLLRARRRSGVPVDPWAGARRLAGTARRLTALEPCVHGGRHGAEHLSCGARSVGLDPWSGRGLCREHLADARDSWDAHDRHERDYYRTLDNPDVDLRLLERAARQGDLGSLQRLWIEAQRRRSIPLANLVLKIGSQIMSREDVPGGPVTEREVELVAVTFGADEWLDNLRQRLHPDHIRETYGRETRISERPNPDEDLRALRRRAKAGTDLDVRRYDQAMERVGSRVPFVFLTHYPNHPSGLDYHVLVGKADVRAASLVFRGQASFSLQWDGSAFVNFPTPDEARAWIAQAFPQGVIVRDELDYPRDQWSLVNPLSQAKGSNPCRKVSLAVARRCADARGDRDVLEAQVQTHVQRYGRLPRSVTIS